ncbi:histidine kinase [Paraglaciecola sp.]|uniref:sensor histidine kinase n=1 Tax=Paraglaciecola sp. TaxID=1920173 RepID=UPI0030F379FA
MISYPSHNLLKVRPALIIVAWTFIGLLLATQAWLSFSMRGESIAWWLPITIWFSWAYLWALLTPLAIKLVERFPLVPPNLPFALIVHLLSGVAIAAFNLALFAAIAPLVGSTNVSTNWLSTFFQLMGSTFLLNLPVYWLIVGIMQTLHLARSARQREQRSLKLEKQLIDAKMLTLRAQLQPHFLFNALNTVSVLMREDVEIADQILIQLSRLLRRAIDASASQKVKLRDEIDFLESYLLIEKTRFSNRLSYLVNIEPVLLDAYVPSLILQPLIENAVQHGLSGLNRAGYIEINGFLGSNTLKLSVLDNGVGMDKSASERVGLLNTRTRLQLLYGKEHSFELTNNDNGGLTVTLIIPLEMELIQWQ